MRSQRIMFLVVGCCSLLIASGSKGAAVSDEAISEAVAAELAVTEISGSSDSSTLVDLTEDSPDLLVAPEVSRIEDLELYPIDPDTVFERYVVGPDGVRIESPAAGDDGVLIYENTKGTFAAAFPQNGLVADDITTTAPGSCKLKRYEVQVTGRVSPTGTGGGYTVTTCLYNNCPQAIPQGQRVCLANTSTSITFPDDAPRTIVFEIPDGGPVVPVPTNVWLGVQFNRANCGAIIGSPAFHGFSADLFDFPGFPCSANAGGFPNQPHASFNARMFGGVDCPASFVNYKAFRPAGSGFSAGTMVQFADDIEFATDRCDMIAYEVGVKGAALYSFDLRADCDGPVIDRTFKQFLVQTGSNAALARFTFNPPVPLNNRQVWFGLKVNNTTGGVIQASPPVIGFSDDIYGYIQPGGDAFCTFTDFVDSRFYSAFQISITCAGEPPVGACCDAFVTECAGGPDDGKPCRDNSFCQSPGTCEATCRQLPEMNCPFPPRGTAFRPSWVEGAACEPDPFAPFACGKAACCKPDDSCQNLTRNECNAVEPVEALRQWQLGRYCNSLGQTCPLNACLGREGECTLPHDSAGCQNPFCCTEVCLSGGVGRVCCDPDSGFGWDSTCVSIAATQDACRDIPPENDECAPTDRLSGARLLEGNTSVEDSAASASVSQRDPGFCCHTGFNPTCAGGIRNGLPCASDAECDGGTCQLRVPLPDTGGLSTVWYKFVAQGTSAQVFTCNSNAPVIDTLLQVFDPEDPTDDATACNSLRVIGCADDTFGCGGDSKHARLCLRNLTAGKLYYVLAAVKNPSDQAGNIRVSIVHANCTATHPATNDWCVNASAISNGVTAFNMANPAASVDCPLEACLPDGFNDQWYNYTATCTGTLTVETCGATSGTSPNTNLAVYEGCDCPVETADGCSIDAGGNCGLASRVQIAATLGQCYKIRLADNDGNRPSGNITIACTAADCQPNSVPDDQDIASGTSQDCNTNGVPDECDVRTTPDCNNNTVPDSCEFDCNLSGVPDSCEISQNPALDCQPNGRLDVCDISGGFSLDVNSNGTPDECEPDCNDNGIPDSFEIAQDPELDCQPNGRIDECDISEGHPDGNSNGIPDECEPSTCPAGAVVWLDPLNGSVDARRPHDPNDVGIRLGIQTIIVQGPPGAGDDCWTLCETAVDGAANSITDVSETAGVYTITLARPITKGAATTITYDNDPARTGTFISHPGNVNADSSAAPADILDLIDGLNGVFVLPYGVLSGDLDRSNVIAPADILEEIDLLNGASAYDVWNGTAKPSATGVCPPP